MEKVNLIEVGPRDGLQNVSSLLTAEQKIAFLQFLIKKGFSHIEAGSFVRPDKVPAMADTDKIALTLKEHNQKLWYLVPNLKGLQNALNANVNQLAFFTAASNSFNKKISV
jgi:hydroxymethylglutaryl-CoA lyase